MSIMLEALGFRLDADNVGTLGTDLFLAKMPESPDACITVYEYGGTSPSFTMGSGLYAIRNPQVQVMVRGAREDYPTAFGIAEDAMDSLSAIVNESITGTFGTVNFARVQPTTSINYLGPDANDRPKLSVNFQVFLL